MTFFFFWLVGGKGMDVPFSKEKIEWSSGGFGMWFGILVRKKGGGGVFFFLKFYYIYIYIYISFSLNSI